MSGIEQALPWYREPWPWIVMAVPATAVVAGIVMATLAFSGADGLVADDYYKQGLAMNRTIAREQAARELGIRGEITFEADRVSARFTARRPLPDRIRLTLAHATRAGRDQVVHLAKDAQGVHRAPLAGVSPGRWTVIIEGSEWRLAATIDLAAGKRLEVGAAPD